MIVPSSYILHPSMATAMFLSAFFPPPPDSVHNCEFHHVAYSYKSPYASIWQNIGGIWDCRGEETFSTWFLTVYRTLAYSGRPKKSNLRSWFDISSQAVSNYPEGVIFEWVCINIPLWIYSRAQHTLFCHLCHCELITGSLSLSLIQSLKPLSKGPPYSSLNPSTSMIFPRISVPLFLSLCICLLSIHLFQFTALSLLWFARATVTRASFPLLSWFPFTHLSGFLPSSLPPVSLRRFSFIPGFLCSLLVPAISRRKISDVPNGLIRRIKQHSTNTMEMSDRKL